MIDQMRKKFWIRNARFTLLLMVMSTVSSDSFLHDARPWTDTRSGTVPMLLDAINDGENVAESSSSAVQVLVHENVAEYVGVAAPLNLQSNITKQLARWTWKTRRAVLTVLHLLDPLKQPPDNCINLECLWWKALFTTNPQSPAFDNGWTYDMLPSFSRRITKFRWLHPRLIHAQLEIRTAYLNQAIANEIELAFAATHKKKKIRIISLGAGYDVRSIRLAGGNSNVVCFEFDLPDTVSAKKQLLEERLMKRRLNISQEQLPTLIGLDLNDVDAFQNYLREIVLQDDDNKDDWYTIFVMEGVLMYLKQGVAARVLATCAAEIKGASASLCFADRLENVTDIDMKRFQRALQTTGWTLTDWAPNPSAHARHMGTARLWKKQ